MGLFGRNKELPPLVSDHSTVEVNFNSVLEYLEGLSKADYDKIIKVANVYRNANKDANKILGLKDEPTATINKESQAEAELDADDDIPFILDDELQNEKPKNKNSKPKKITVTKD